MYGVDKYAHQTCVDYGGKTVAVLGWGIDTKLTGDDLKLAKKIQKAMMARRGLEFTEKDEELFDELFEKTKGEREKAGVKKEKLSFK